MDNISKWGLPNKYTACPGCGRQYGHHNTKVDTISEECSKCAKDYDSVYLIEADKFITEYVLPTV